MFRWIKGQWKDIVSLSRSPLLLYSRMAGAAYTWWWDTHTHTQSNTPVKHYRNTECVNSHQPTSSLCLPQTAHIWVKNCKELLPSSFNASRFDQPLQATEWLRNFRTTNGGFLSKVKILMRVPFVRIRLYLHVLHFLIWTWLIRFQIKTCGVQNVSHY